MAKMIWTVDDLFTASTEASIQYKCLFLTYPILLFTVMIEATCEAFYHLPRASSSSCNIFRARNHKCLDSLFTKCRHLQNNNRIDIFICDYSKLFLFHLIHIVVFLRYYFCNSCHIELIVIITHSNPLPFRTKNVTIYRINSSYNKKFNLHNSSISSFD